MLRRLLTVAALAAASLSIAAAQNPDQYGGVDLAHPKLPHKAKKPTTRTLKGTVVDDSGRPLQGALVTLTNLQKGEKITFITKKDGRYSFDDVAFNVDYEVAARAGNLHSETKKLSQYDDTVNFVRILEVAPSKDADKN